MRTDEEIMASLIDEEYPICPPQQKALIEVQLDIRETLLAILAKLGG